MDMTKTDKTASRKAVLYLRVSTARQADEGMSLDDQEARLRAAAIAQGFESVEVIADEGRSGGSMKSRTGLSRARAMLKAGEADALISTKLDRISRKTKDVLELVEESDKHGWRMIVLDVNLDTESPVGRMVLTVLAAMSEMERERIAERQRDSHAHRRSLGQVWGLTHGPKTQIPEPVLARIVAERNEGRSLQAIANGLNADNVATVRGGLKWHASTIRQALESMIVKA